MTRMSLVRHGQTSWNAEGRLVGWTDVPLDEVGEQQAAYLGAAVEVSRYSAVWTSDLQRATATARLAGWEAHPDRRLREIDFGELEGSTWNSITPDLRDGLVAFEGFAAPGGESTASLVARITSFLDERRDGPHLLVTHGGVIRAVLRLCGESGAFPRHGQVYTIDWNRRLLTDVQTPTV